MRFLFNTIILFFLFSHSAVALAHSKTVTLFVEAFNQRNIDDMLSFAAPDMRWMSVSGSQIAVETSSQAQLRTAMQGYFDSTPSAKSRIRSLHESGPFVYALEEASWLHNNALKKQCSMAVYAFSDAKIQSVWYFPAHQCQ